ncbi:ATP-binding cassette domain-containing protein [Spiroplasma endosymbiont of Othius punctulatus]|uniref:ATP-binding cassette domain-containing protein n=1 Tax=Spiroplasma endosymbiont of Othius punctulatus TaxID=3066289 RepID=UPI0030CB4961
MAGWVVNLDSVAKVFGKDVWALKRINLKIEKNETLAIIGPRYSGKSILASIIGNQVAPSNGIVEYNFKQTNLLKAIGYTQRSLEWPTGIKIKDIVNLYTTSFEVKDDEWMSKLYDVFDIEKSLNKKVDNNDKTFLKMFSLFLTFIPKPELVIIDEITQVMSMDNKEIILNFMKEYKEEFEASYVITNPDDFTFNFLCDRLVVMNKGFIIREHKKSEHFTYSDYSLDIISRIKQKSVKPLTPDPVMKPIVDRFSDKFNNYTEHRTKFRAKMSKLILTPEVEILNQTLSNISQSIKKFNEKLVEYSENFITKSAIRKLNDSIKSIEKKHEKYLKDFKKQNIPSEYEEIFNKFNPWLSEFVRFLKTELLPMLQLKVMYEENENYLTLSQQEKKDLNKLKKKLIKDEIKEIKKASRSK